MQPDEYGWPETTEPERSVLRRLREYPCIVGTPERTGDGWRVAVSTMDADGTMVIGKGHDRAKALVDAAVKLGLQAASV